MKINYFILITLSLSLLLFFSCKEDRTGDMMKPGIYGPNGFTTNEKGGDRSCENIPMFHFIEGGKVKITQDFDYGFFKDSLFSHKIEDGFLYLYGDNTKHKIAYDTTEVAGQYIFYVDSKYITSISVDRWRTEDVKPGIYNVHDLKRTEEGMDISIKYLPVFYFAEEGKVKITPDFDFGYFKDSLFNYKLEDGYLYLYGDNIEHKIVCNTVGMDHFDFFVNSKYISRVGVSEF